MLTLTKKTWKYIFYAVIALVLLYVVFFSSTRERFTSVNPLPTGADMDALLAVFNKERDEGRLKFGVPDQSVTATILKRAPESIKSVIKFSRSNIIPLMPYKVVKGNTNPDGSDNFDFWTLSIIPMYKDLLFVPLAYAVKQQSSPPTLPAFIDMAVKVVRDNGHQPPPTIDAQQQGIIDQAKKGETTIQMPDGDTYPNPGYWAYKYIYGDPKAAPSGPASSSSSTSRTGGAASGGGGGGGGIGSGKCTPSLQQIPGGITETRCFN